MRRLALLFACFAPIASATATPVASGLDAAIGWLVERVRVDAPRVRSAGFAVQAADGALREARGDFDPAFRLTTTLDVARGELLPVVVRQQQQTRRLFDELDENFSATADRLQAQLDASEGPVAIECDGVIIVINGREICDTPEAAAERQAMIELLTTLLGTAPSEESLIAIGALRDQLLGDNRAVVEDTIEQLRRVAEESRIARLRLGDVPDSERRTTLTIDAAYDIPMRRGWTLTPQLLLEGVDDTFEGKPRDPRFGGKGLDRVFRSAVGATLAIPLGRGGAAVVGSREDVADLQLESIRSQARSISQVALRDALVGYARLLAAVARESLAERRNARIDALAGTAAALVEADEIAPELLSQVDAMVAQARADRSIARRLRIVAERELASLFGIGRRALAGLPIDADGLARLAELPVCAAPERWPALAVEQRPDIDTLRWRQRAAERLARTAEDLLRPRADLAFTLAYGGRDERDPLLAGFANSVFDGMAGPSVLVTFSWDMRLRNDAARGRLVTALALVEQATIALDEARRSAARSLQALARTLASGAESLHRQREAARRYRDANAALTELVLLGESDLLPLVTSEEQLEAAEAARIDAEEAQVRRLIELRLALGTLWPPSPRQADMHWLAHDVCGATELTER